MVNFSGRAPLRYSETKSTYPHVYMPTPPKFQGRSRSRRPGRTKLGALIEVCESSEFLEDSSRVLTARQKEELLVGIANNPLQGRPHPVFPELLEVSFIGHKIIYNISPDYSTINMVEFRENGGDDSDDPKGGPGKSRAIEAIGLLVKGGIFGIGKKLGESLLNALDLIFNVDQHHFSLENLLIRLR